MSELVEVTCTDCGVVQKVEPGEEYECPSSYCEDGVIKASNSSPELFDKSEE